MKILEQVGHQGDVQLYKISEIPKNAKKIDKQFIAASERSGSFHALFGNYNQYEVEDGFVLECKEDCILNHSLQASLTGTSMEDAKVLPKKDHRHSVIKKGLYYAGIQNKFNPLKGFMERVID
jgi:hypothetical protein